VIAAGGDGTVNEVVNGLVGSETALAVLPGGTANVWAREIGAPTHPGSVAAMIERGRRVRMDVGVAGDRCFLLMASLGLDSAVAAMMTPAAKARFGRNAYIVAGLREAFRYRAVRAEIVADGQSWSGPLLLALLGNTRLYGGLISISHRASARDGLLDLVIYRDHGVPGFAAHLLRTVAGRHTGYAGAHYRQVREAFVTTTPSVPVQADGEIIGETPMRFSVRPNAIAVIVPAESRAAALS
jgi:YegS/Rv2252/BmrU family lipid kinase